MQQTVSHLKSNFYVTNLWKNDYANDFKEWPDQAIISKLSFKELINLRLKTIEWEFGKSELTGKDVVVRIRMILSNGLKSPIFGLDD